LIFGRQLGILLTTTRLASVSTLICILISQILSSYAMGILNEIWLMLKGELPCTLFVFSPLMKSGPFHVLIFNSEVNLITGS